MKERIKDLWRGTIDPQSDGILTTPETTQIMGFIHRHRDALYKTLTDEQQEIFEKLDDCWAEYNHLIEEAIFVYAYRLGAQLMIETLTDDE